jgi:hypothetical protein
MPGLDPGIHSVTLLTYHRLRMDGRVKPCHDDKWDDPLISASRTRELSVEG